MVCEPDSASINRGIVHNPKGMTYYNPWDPLLGWV